MDATPLSRLAGQLEQCSAMLRTRADVVALQIGATHWYSAAGRLALARVEGATDRLTTSADRIEGIAASVRILAVAAASRP